MRSLHAPSAYEGPPPDIPYLVDTLLKLKVLPFLSLFPPFLFGIAWISCALCSLSHALRDGWRSQLPAIPIPENRSGMLHMTLPRTRKGASQRSGSGFSSRVMKRPAEQPLEGAKQSSAGSSLHPSTPSAPFSFSFSCHTPQTPPWKPSQGVHRQLPPGDHSRQRPTCLPSDSSNDLVSDWVWRGTEANRIPWHSQA